MMNDFARNNLRFLAISLALISVLALFFLMISWLVGGTAYFRDELLGNVFVPVLAVLAAFGAISGYLLRDRKGGGSGGNIAFTGTQAWNT